MKKALALILVFSFILILAGCSSNTNKDAPVFKTENIRSITFISFPGPAENVVSDEYLPEITSWLGSFTIGEKVKGDILPPGSNSISVKIEYEDGTVVENGLTTVTVDGKTYFMESDDAPECYFDVFS